jgi:hypothetical protein
MIKTEEEKKALPDPYKGIHSDAMYKGGVGPESWSNVAPNLSAPEPQKKYTPGASNNFATPQEPDFTPHIGNQQVSVLDGSNVQGIAGERPQQDLYIKTRPPIKNKGSANEANANETNASRTDSIALPLGDNSTLKSSNKSIEPRISWRFNEGATFQNVNPNEQKAIPAAYEEQGLVGQGYDDARNKYNRTREFRALPDEGERVLGIQPYQERNELMAAAGRSDRGFVGETSLDPETAKIAEERKQAGREAMDSYSQALDERNMMEGAHGKKQAWLAHQRIAAMRAAKSNEMKAKYGIDIDSMMKRSTLDRNAVAMDRDKAEIKKVDAETKNLVEGKRDDWRTDQKKLEYVLSARLNDPGLFDSATGLKDDPEYKSADENGRIALRDTMAARLLKGDIGPLAKGGNGTEAQAEEKPPVPGAKKRKSDGKWFVQVDGEWNLVG